ncbi:MAG TPA: DUF2785 domain-containing protein [Sporichthyaceae bacterium]|nr:DUF2785 domain-containing protein [Sporichthyaceae bacterium]
MRAQTPLEDDGESHVRADPPVDPDFWERVVATGYATPAGRRLDDMTVELVRLLGATDPHLRDHIGLGVLLAWTARGVYDDLLPGLGDGLTDGLRTGAGESGTHSVLRRSFSARAVAAVIDRDTARPRVNPDTVLAWGDRGLAWLGTERDLRDRIPGAGRVHAIAHGADLVGALARSRHLDEGGLMVLLDTVADRLLAPTESVFVSREEDRLAYATMSLLHRDVVDLSLLEPWVGRLVETWTGAWNRDAPIQANTLNTIAFLRALHLQLLLGVAPTDPAGRSSGRPPAVRVDLLALLQAALRSTGPFTPRTDR